MRMDLPGCNFKYCFHQLDGNCTRYNRQQLNDDKFCNHYNLQKKDVEIRKPLEEEIERLKEELKEKKLEADMYRIGMSLYCENFKQAQTKVLDELLEFIKEKEHFEGLIGHWGGMTIDLTLLKQKLNKIKGETK